MGAGHSAAQRASWDEGCAPGGDLPADLPMKASNRSAGARRDASSVPAAGVDHELVADEQRQRLDLFAVALEPIKLPSADPGGSEPILEFSAPASS